MKTFIFLFCFSYISAFGQSSFSLKPYNEYNELFPVSTIQNSINNKIYLGKDSITYKYILQKNEILNIKNIIFSLDDSSKTFIETCMRKDSNLSLYFYLAVHDWDEGYSTLGEKREVYDSDSRILNNIQFNQNILLKNKQICVTVLLMNQTLNLTYEKRIIFANFVYVRFIEN